MIDHIIGRPSSSWRRAQVFFVMFFWIWRILRGNPSGETRMLRRLNRALRGFQPWQLVASTLTGVYAARNLDKLLGLHAPEPLARLYSPAYYRATWISTGLDAGFATAMSIRPKWVRDICSVLFGAYYIVYAHEADEKLRRFRAVPTVEMLRTTWEKTTNPYIKLVTHLPSLGMRRKILLPRPHTSKYTRPITAYLYFAPGEKELSKATDLILDLPGGGFVAMTPEHHEERLRMWAAKTGKPVLAIDYGKAPEYPYPWAIEEAFDTYKVIVESVGTLVGMSGRRLNVIISGDSAGAALAVNVVIKLLETNTSSNSLPMPLALVLNYPALDFNFKSWMSPEDLNILRAEQSSGNLHGISDISSQKDHMAKVSPLSMVGDRKSSLSRRSGQPLRRRQSWKDSFRGSAAVIPSSSSSRSKASGSTSSRLRPVTRAVSVEDQGALADAESEDEDYQSMKEEDRPLAARVRFVPSSPPKRPAPILRSESALEREQESFSVAVAEADAEAFLSVGGRSRSELKDKSTKRATIGTRLTMTSRTGFFQDRIISPAMMRAMAILYIGPGNPDFATDYRVSPILTPAHLLAQFPPVLIQCGEKDPFNDDSVIFSAKLREAKQARKTELDLAISGKSARFGEGLRMSVGELPSNSAMAAMKRERDQLASETEEDWVQLVLFSDWSHGYLQMAAIMPEAKAVIDELAEWIDVAFERYRPVVTASPPARSPPSTSRVLQPGLLTVTSPLTSETETDGDSIITFGVKRPQYRSTPEKRTGSFHVPSPRTSSEATIVEEVLSSSPKSRSKLETENVLTPPRVSAKTGQTLTEGELFARRRLLDADMFN